MHLGIYISVPFCKSKCSYCNFASGVFSKQVFKRYVDRVVEDIVSFAPQPVALQPLAPQRTDAAKEPPLCHADAAPTEPAREEGGGIPITAAPVDSLYLGGGTPTLLEPAQLERLFAAVRENFEVAPNVEVTVECAPGTLTPEVIDTLLRCGANRVSLGVQSFIDKEATSVARLHTRAITLDDIARLRSAGIANINIDLIAGLPHQTRESWEQSLSQLIDTGVPHASVYMLEVDEDSRLGRELIAGGAKYHAHFVPDDDLTAELYERACERLNAAGIAQYEISNFARQGHESRHNLKYWTRRPYLGFGVDAHSMIPTTEESGVPHPLAVLWRKGGVREADLESIRFCTPDNLERYLAGEPSEETKITHTQALEESHFLGLRLNRGINFDELTARYGETARTAFREELDELIAENLIERNANRLCLTDRGRLLSNEVFSRFLKAEVKQ